MIKLIRSLKVTPTETHFELSINKKVVQIAKWVDDDFSTDYEFIKGNELLTEDELHDVIDYIEDKRI